MLRSHLGLKVGEWPHPAGGSVSLRLGDLGFEGRLSQKALVAFVDLATQDDHLALAPFHYLHGLASLLDRAREACRILHVRDRRKGSNAKPPR